MNESRRLATISYKFSAISLPSRSIFLSLSYNELSSCKLILYITASCMATIKWSGITSKKSFCNCLKITFKIKGSDYFFTVLVVIKSKTPFKDKCDKVAIFSLYKYLLFFFNFRLYYTLFKVCPFCVNQFKEFIKIYS